MFSVVKCLKIPMRKLLTKFVESCYTRILNWEMKHTFEPKLTHILAALPVNGFLGMNGQAQVDR